MPAEPESKVTCYSAGEGRFMQRSQAIRGRLLAPLLDLLAALRIRPNHLTLLSLCAGLAFCPAFILGHRMLAFGLLLLHVVLDGIDGPLARYIGRASNQGSFTDTMADQVVVTFSTVTLIHAGYAGVWPGGLYVFFYGLVVGFAMVRSALRVPYSWLVRPRFFVYAWAPVEVFVRRGGLDLLLWVLTALLALKVITGFVQIRRRIPD